MPSNQTITIDLNPVLEGFCRWIFNSHKRENIKLRLDDEFGIGDLIYSKIQTSRKKNPRKSLDNTVSFTIPVTSNNHYELKTKKVYLKAFHEEQIVSGINSQFRKWCREMFEKGYLRNVEGKHIAEAILRGLNVRNNKDNFDMVIKNDYRHRVTNQQKRFNLLVNEIKSAV